MLAAPLNVAAGVVVEEVVEEDVVVAFEAVAAGVVELPAGKGMEVVDVFVDDTGATGVEEVDVVIVVEEVEVEDVEVVEDVEDVDDVEDVLEVLEALEAPLAIGVAPEPEQGKVTM